MPEAEEAIAELGLSPGDELEIGGQWAVFEPIANELVGVREDDALLDMFLSVWAGPYAEEEFLDTDEMRDALGAVEYPPQFAELVDSAEKGFTDEDNAAIFSSEWGWTLAYPDRVLRFRSPLDLLEHLAAK